MKKLLLSLQVLVLFPFLLGAQTITSTQTNVLCNSAITGEIDITITAGVTPYTYLWNNLQTIEDITGLASGTYTVIVSDFTLVTVTKTITITQPTAVSVTPSITSNVKCKGGSDGVAAGAGSGGTTGYTYMWTSGETTWTATGLSVGTNWVTVTDANSCLATGSVTLTEPSALTLTTAIVTVTCNGGSNGSISSTVTGGTTAYTYLWTGGGTASSASSLTAGTYGITVTDGNGCTTQASLTVTQPVALSLTATGTNTSCNSTTNGTGSVIASGSTGYTYMWTGGGTTAAVSGLSVGTNWVTVTDSKGCWKTASITLTQSGSGMLFSTTATNTTCNSTTDGTGTIAVTGGVTAYSYMWTGGGTTASVTGLSVGTNWVTVTDANGCWETVSITITQTASGMTVTAGGTNLSCASMTDGTGSVTVTGTTGYTYVWIGGGTTASVSGLSAGTNWVTITDANGCWETASITLTQAASGMTVTIAGTNTSCSSISNGAASVTVTGGTTAYSYMWTGGATTWAVTGLSLGTHWVTITDASTCWETASVTITQTPSSMNITVTGSYVGCVPNTGTGSVSVSGSTGYTYMWTGGGTTASNTGLASGVNWVTVSDVLNCNAIGSITITSAASAMTVTWGSTNVTCNGLTDGWAGVTVTGGTTYTYLWNGGATTWSVSGLVAGTASVVVSDINGCTISSSTTITQPSAITLTWMNTSITCNNGTNGTILISVAGGVSGYSYAWGGGQSTASLTGLSAATYAVIVTDATGCTIAEGATIAEPSAIAINSTITDASCGSANGAISVMGANGSSTNYTYLWSGGATTWNITGLVAATYSVTVTSGACSDSTNLTVIEVPTGALTITTVAVSPTCNGGSDGSATATVIGGNTPYTYAWNGGSTTNVANGLNAGNTTLNVTDVCGGAGTIITLITNPLVLWDSIVVQICAGDSIFLEGSYRFTAGDYDDILVSAAGCDSLLTSTLVVNAYPALSIAANSGQDNIICDGASVTLNATTSSTAITWNPGSLSGASVTVSPTTTTTYTIDALENGCTTTTTYEVTVLTVPTSTIVQTEDLSTCRDDIVITTTGAITGYTWLMPNGGTITTSSNTRTLYKADTDLTYTLVTNGTNGCTSTNSITVTGNSGCSSISIEELENETARVFINDVNETLQIELPAQVSGKWNISVIDITGRTVLTDQITSNTAIQIADWKAGIYVVILENKGLFSTFKVGKK